MRAHAPLFATFTSNHAIILTYSQHLRNNFSPSRTQKLQSTTTCFSPVTLFLSTCHSQLRHVCQINRRANRTRVHTLSTANHSAPRIVFPTLCKSQPLKCQCMSATQLRATDQNGCLCFKFCFDACMIMSRDTCLSELNLYCCQTSLHPFVPSKTPPNWHVPHFSPCPCCRAFVERHMVGRKELKPPSKPPTTPLRAKLRPPCTHICPFLSRARGDVRKGQVAS